MRGAYPCLGKRLELKRPLDALPRGRQAPRALRAGDQLRDGRAQGHGVGAGGEGGGYRRHWRALGAEYPGGDGGDDGAGFEHDMAVRGVRAGGDEMSLRASFGWVGRLVSEVRTSPTRTVSAIGPSASATGDDYGGAQNKLPIPV